LPHLVPANAASHNPRPTTRRREEWEERVDKSFAPEAYQADRRLDYLAVTDD
jgi:hypothetical protein